MFTFFTKANRLLQAVAPIRRNDPVRQLMECAGARAGQNPRQARELRQAAQAWLRVIR